MITAQIETLLQLPREQQVAAARALIASLPAAENEAWNTTFGAGSLFEAWTATSIARRVHSALAQALEPIVAKPGFVVIDVGGGDGSVWTRAFTPDARGTLVVVDPLAEAAQRVAEVVPPGVHVESRIGSIQDVELPSADALVCSMTLHHVAGADADDRARNGLDGIGKLEVLQAFGRALQPSGVGFLVEADVDCDLDLPSGSSQLADNIFDSYVRRCAVTVIDDLRNGPAEMHPRWEHLLRHWFLEQLLVADLPITQRDVYELTVPRWTALIERAGLTLDQVRCVDHAQLFHLYRFRP